MKNFGFCKDNAGCAHRVSASLPCSIGAPTVSVFADRVDTVIPDSSRAPVMARTVDPDIHEARHINGEALRQAIVAGRTTPGRIGRVAEGTTTC